ncbi:hypothetical protein [Bradyrhizobium diazoefficiens]
MLDATQRETLRNGIGDAFDFHDLDLVVEKCLGSRRINDVTADGQPTRLIALACIDLMEQEKVTVAFMQFIVGSPKCPAKLASDAIAIFPELQTVGKPFNDIVTTATTSLADNAVRIADQLTDRIAIQKLADSIAELKCYKSLHEALHQIRLSARPELPDGGTLIDPEFRREVRQFVAVLRTSSIKANDALNELPVASPQRAAQQPWINMIRDCAARLQSSLAASDIVATELALDVTARTIDPLPDQINKRIFEIAKQLPLEALLEGLGRALGAEAGPAAEALRQAIEAIGALRLALLTRVMEHSRWQDTDNALFSLDTTFKQATTEAFKKFTRQWPPTRKQLQALIEAESRSEWASELRQSAGDVDHALGRVEQSFGSPPATGSENLFRSIMFDPYEGLRLIAQTQFFSVDSALKQNCMELLRIQAPLTTITGKISL